MLNKLLMAAISMFLTLGTNAQDRFFTKTGTIEFTSRASMEDIEAKNKTAAALLDTKTGVLQFSVLMKAFEFEKALMEEHFNENYVESHKFPKAEFKGTIVNNGKVVYTKDGSYPVQVKGKLTLHGVTKDVTAPGTIKVSGGKIEATSLFNVRLSDYGIKIPAMVKDKISNVIAISVDCRMEPLRTR